MYSHFHATINFAIWRRAVEALVSNYLGNSEKWSQLEPVAYENGVSLAAMW